MEYLEDNQYFDDYARLDVSPPDYVKKYYYEGNESVVEVGDKSNNYLSHTMYVNIPSYQVQNMNYNQLKDKLGKIKAYVWSKNILYEGLLTVFK